MRLGTTSTHAFRTDGLSSGGVGRPVQIGGARRTNFSAAGGGSGEGRRDRRCPRLRTTPPTSSSPKASRRASARPAANEPMEKCDTRRSPHAKGVAKLLGLPLDRTVKCIMLATDAEGQPARGGLLMIRRSRGHEDQGHQDYADYEKFRWASEPEIIGATGCQSGLSRSRRIPADCHS